MKALSVNFWEECNNHCIFCFCREKDFLAEKLSPKVASSVREVEKALLQHQSICDFLIISGNEPTLNPGLSYLILFAKKIGYKVEIRTNGRTLKDKKFCSKLLRIGLDSIGVTLLSHDSKTHDFLTRVKGSFQETASGIKNFISLGNPEKITLYNVINKFNFRQLPESLAFYDYLGAKNVQLNFVYHNNKKIVPRFSDLKEYLDKALALAIKLDMKIGAYGIPLCFLGKYRNLATEFGLRNEVVLGGRISDYNYVRTKMGKRRAKYCRSCSQKDICEGTWKSYYNVYGEEEFKRMIINE